jgi:hypothetical protein
MGGFDTVLLRMKFQIMQIQNPPNRFPKNKKTKKPHVKS